MSKDYKKRAPARRPPPKGSMPGWAWLSIGLAIGLFAGFLFYLSKRPAPPHTVLTLPKIVKPTILGGQSAPKPAQQKAPAETAQDSAPPKFDFYTLLPKLEVVVPANKGSQTDKPIHDATPSPSAPPQKIETPGSYMLQTGSFGTYAQANRMKASLALLGFVSNITQVKVDSNTWYRVQIGPFNNVQKLNAARDELSKHNVDSLALKING